MSTTEAIVERYALDSPNPSALAPPTCPSAPSSSTPAPSAFARQKNRLSVRPRARRVSSQPALPSTASASTASPARSASSSLVPPPSAFPAQVLTTPDPADAVAPERRSVQIAAGGPVNWSRPIPAPPSPPATAAAASATPPFGPASSSSSASRSYLQPRRTMTSASVGPAQPRRSLPATPASSCTSEDDLPVTPLLPPGAAGPEVPSQRSCSWSVVTECKGLGMVGIADFDASQAVPQPRAKLSQAPSLVLPTTRSSCSSTCTSEGSLAGESVATASTASGPTTPTRLQFVSETLETLSNPANLDELRSLRAKAAELDMESKRLRRLKGRDQPAPTQRLLPRKAVPAVTAFDLQPPSAGVLAKPRRPAVRHSLIVASTSAAGDNQFAYLADPAPGAGAARLGLGLGPSAFAAPHAHPSASRRPFYAQGKAAMSVIEFSPRKDSVPQYARLQPLNMTVAPAAPAPAAATSAPQRRLPSVPGLGRRDKAAERAHAPLLLPVAPQRQGSTSASASPPAAAKLPLPRSPTTPTAVQIPTGVIHTHIERSPSVKTGGFFNKHKKLSRFLGKPQPA